jgi:hypothetical protein
VGGSSLLINVAASLADRRERLRRAAHLGGVGVPAAVPQLPAVGRRPACSPPAVSAVIGPPGWLRTLGAAIRASHGNIGWLRTLGAAISASHAGIGWLCTLRAAIRASHAGIGRLCNLGAAVSASHGGIGWLCSPNAAISASHGGISCLLGLLPRRASLHASRLADMLTIHKQLSPLPLFNAAFALTRPALRGRQPCSWRRQASRRGVRHGRVGAGARLLGPAQGGGEAAELNDEAAGAAAGRRRGRLP